MIHFYEKKIEITKITKYIITKNIITKYQQQHPSPTPSPVSPWSSPSYSYFPSLKLLSSFEPPPTEPCFPDPSLLAVV